MTDTPDLRRRLCPSCQAADNNPYVDDYGQNMRACGRCMIQWVDNSAGKPAPDPALPELFNDVECMCREEIVSGPKRVDSRFCSMHSRGGARLESDELQFKLEHSQAQTRSANALIDKIQKIVGDFFGENERWSEFDVLDQGVRKIAEQARAVSSPAPSLIEDICTGCSNGISHCDCDKRFGEPVRLIPSKVNPAGAGDGLSLPEQQWCKKCSGILAKNGKCWNAQCEEYAGQTGESWVTGNEGKDGGPNV